MSKRPVYESYRKDEFDTPAAGPTGVHRGSRSVLSRLIPFIVTLIIAALLGLLVWGIATNNLSKLRFPWQATSNTTSGVTTTDTGTDTNNQTTGTDDGDDDGDGTINKDTSILVINATETDGYAGRAQVYLQQQGYTEVTAANPTDDDLPTSSVVYYEDDEDKTTAENVAVVTGVGIHNVQQKSDLQEPIVVVLVD